MNKVNEIPILDNERNLRERPRKNIEILKKAWFQLGTGGRRKFIENLRNIKSFFGKKSVREVILGIAPEELTRLFYTVDNFQKIIRIDSIFSIRTVSPLEFTATSYGIPKPPSPNDQIAKAIGINSPNLKSIGLGFGLIENNKTARAKVFDNHIACIPRDSSVTSMGYKDQPVESIRQERFIAVIIETNQMILFLETLIMIGEEFEYYETEAYACEEVPEPTGKAPKPLRKERKSSIDLLQEALRKADKKRTMPKPVEPVIRESTDAYFESTSTTVDNSIWQEVRQNP